MRIANISEMIRGWFVGDFEPTLHRTTDVEVAVKEYRKGDIEQAHFHKLATEITVVVSGQVRMFNRTWRKGDILVVEPGDITSFEALEDSVNVVVKIPGANHDKYIVGGENDA